jgi:hypothetical protein
VRIPVGLWQFPRWLGVATGGLRHPRPGLKQRDPGIFGLVLATSGAVVRTAVVACRPFLHDSLIRRWHRGRCLGCESRESV